MGNLRVVAESTVHHGRRLLVNERGEGYLQLSPNAIPLAVAAGDFARLLEMRHYRPVRSTPRKVHSPAPEAVAAS